MLHFKISAIVILGILLSNLIDADHLPIMFLKKRWYLVDCLYHPECHLLHPEKVEYYTNKNILEFDENIPLHNIWFAGFMFFVTMLTFKYSKNPLLSFFVLGLFIGIIIHLLADGYGWRYFHDIWFPGSDTFKHTIFGLK